MKIAHVTDSHEDITGLKSAANALTAVGDCDLIIHTGDISNNCFEDSINNAISLLPTYAAIIGNHDSILQKALDPAGYRWEIQPTLKQKYNKYFLNRTPENVSIEKDKTWWYCNLKDVRVIGIDYTTRGDDYYDQWYWLESQLEDCERLDKPVFIASHAVSRKRIVRRESDFTAAKSLEYMLDSMYPDTLGLYPMQSKSYEIVVNHCDEHGLKVLAWIYGHEHADVLMTSDNNNKFPMIILGSSIHDPYNDVVRSNTPNYRDDAVVNVYEWSDDTDSLLITRYGECSCYSGCLRDFTAYDFDRSEFVSKEARGI